MISELFAIIFIFFQYLSVYLFTYISFVVYVIFSFIFFSFFDSLRVCRKQFPSECKTGNVAELEDRVTEEISSRFRMLRL